MKDFKKTLLISFIILVLVVVYAVLGGVLHIGTDLLFLGIIVWAKCFHLSLKPADVLKCWTGAAVGVGIMLAEHAVGGTAGTIVLLVLVFVQIIFDVGSISDWIVNPSIPFFLTVALILANFMSAGDIVKQYCLSFLGACVPIIIIGMILAQRKAKS